jgi:cysteine desulfurase / selenocysteine lyase
MTTMNINKIRLQFPILRQKINGHPLVYLDSAATSQKPQVVIDAITKYYEEYNSNIHRSIHTLADKATEAYEEARSRIAKFINAESEEIIFVRNSNEGVNVVAGGIVELLNLKFEIRNLKSKDENLNLKKNEKGDQGEQGNRQKLIILTTIAEHHANLVPWLRLQNQGKAEIKYIPINKEGEMDLEWLKKFIKEYNGQMFLVAVTFVSNVLGVTNPIREIKEIVGKPTSSGLRGASRALILVDAAQAVAHFPIDVKKLEADFLVFSGHKVFGPTGTSVLWGRKELLELLPPFLVGSSMIDEVTDKNYTVQQIPTKFEAGTPDIAGAIGLGEAVEWLMKIRKSENPKNQKLSSKFKFQISKEEAIEEKERRLLQIAIEGLEKIEGVKIIGTHNVKKRSGLVSFTVKNIHPHDIAALLDKKGIAVRAGHHCAEPLHKYLGIDASVRASFSIFNTEGEMEYFVKSLGEVVEYLKK